MKGPILPGATIGIFGGGQLGRMTAMAARTLGYHIHALDPDPTCAARFVVDHCLAASFDDVDAATALASHAQVVTFEIEKIAPASLDAAAKLAPVRPAPEVLQMVQDRSRQKTWLASRGFPVGPWKDARSGAEIADAIRALGGPVIAKACSGGYDGRGQVRLADPAEADRAHAELGGAPAVVEKRLALREELSVMVARRPSGDVAIYPPALNHHDAGILTWSVLPAPLPAEVIDRAKEIARGIAEALSLEGLLAVEFFWTEDGEVLVNELSPRTHNTFHATEMACLTSQFEQAVRAVCDLPLGSVELVRPTAIENLLGDLWSAGPPAFDRALALPGVRLHLYGKHDARPGRKMGHLSAVAATPEDAVALVHEAKRRLAR